MKVEKNIPLSNYTSYKIGGPAKYFARISNVDELRKAFELSKKENLPHFVLGGGSNSLISSDGFDGLVIKQENNELKQKGTKLELGAGLSLQDAVQAASNYGLKGIEWGEGIPGNVGGAVRGNAGAFGGELKDVVESIKVYDPAHDIIKEYHNNEAEFAYRTSIFKHKACNEIILSTTLNLDKGNIKDLERKRNQYRLFRLDRHPQEPSCGSVFQNVKDFQFIKYFIEQHSEIRDIYIKKWHNKIPAAYFVAEAGLSGFQMGNAQVSPQHTNFIINTGKAEADEIARLISFVKSRVHERFGVNLREEVQYIGW